MLKDTEFLRTFRFYNHKNHRLSIFGKYYPDSQLLRVWILTISSIKDKETGKALDTFSKKKAKELFEEYISYREGDEQPEECKPMIYSIPCTSVNYKHIFVEFCRENYNIKEEIAIGLIDSDKMILIDCYTNSIKNTCFPDAKTLRLKTNPNPMVMEEEIENAQFLDFEGMLNNIFEGKN